MGIVMGSMLAAAGASVTYLVRKHHLARLAQPQRLYCYDDNSLKAYKGYDCIVEPSSIADHEFDYVLIALDGVALRSEEGAALVRMIGNGVRGKSTQIIVGTIGIGMKAYFAARSGLPDAQISSGALATMAYAVRDVQLPLHPPTDPDLLKQADLAYVHGRPYDFAVDDTAPEAARNFADILNAGGGSRCVVKGADDLATTVASLFPVFAASDLMGWPKATSLADDPELWELATRAVREVQSLGIHSEPGRIAASTTTGATLIAQFAAWEDATLPLDLAAFNRFHHGGKVNAQDRQLLCDCVATGKLEGKPMTALRQLIALGGR